MKKMEMMSKAFSKLSNFIKHLAEVSKALKEIVVFALYITIIGFIYYSWDQWKNYDPDLKSGVALLQQDYENFFGGLDQQGPCYDRKYVKFLQTAVTKLNSLLEIYKANTHLNGNENLTVFYLKALKADTEQLVGQTGASNLNDSQKECFAPALKSLPDKIKNLYAQLNTHIIKSKPSSLVFMEKLEASKALKVINK